MKSQKVTQLIKNQLTFTNRCIGILEISMQRIVKQGGGCNNPKTGASYVYSNRRDAIAILLGGGQVSSIHFGLISDELQRPIVRKLMHKFQISDIYHQRFVKFLQRLQDIHDAAFDSFNDVDSDRMDYFLVMCKDLKDSLNAK